MNFFRNSKINRANKAYQAKMREAMEAQRNGDIQGYAKLYEEAEGLLTKVHELQMVSK